MVGNVAHEWVPGSRPPADLKNAIESTYGVEIGKRAVSLYQESGTIAIYGSPAEQWAEDVGFRCPTIAQSIWHSAAGNRAFEFEFSRIPGGLKIMRNMHAQDVPYAFGPLMVRYGKQRIIRFPRPCSNTGPILPGLGIRMATELYRHGRRLMPLHAVIWRFLKRGTDCEEGSAPSGWRSFVESLKKWTKRQGVSPNL